MSKLAVITGASAGIGFATAKQLLQAGYDVVNLSRRPCKLDGVISHPVDLVDPVNFALVDTLRTQLAKATVSTVVHCAGLLSSDTAATLDRSELQRSLSVNVVAPAALNGAFISVMKPGSSIVFVSSTLGDKAVPGAFSYVTSKHAVNGMMRATCQDLTGTGIHTAAVSPGFTDTEMLRNHVGNDESILKALATNMCLGRLATPDEIAATIVFCVQNPVINGSVMHANLGQIES
ncbi:MAG: SDR family oxidoreductase [Pseudomonadota bacterium]